MKSFLALTAISIIALAKVSTAGPGFPNCYPQGPGSCTAIYSCEPDYGSGCGGAIFDYACNQIGGPHSGVANPGDVWDSELPWPLDVTVASSDPGNAAFQFMYAGGPWGSGTDGSWHVEDCGIADPNGNVIACSGTVVAFPC